MLAKLKSFLNLDQDRRGYHISENGTVSIDPITAGRISIKHFQSRKYDIVKRRAV